MALRADKNSAQYFVDGRLDWPEGATSRKSMRAVNKLSDLHTLLSQRCEVAAGDRGVDELADLVRAMLQYEPSERMSAAAALAHPFLTLDLPTPPGVDGGGGAMDPTPEPPLLAAAALDAMVSGMDAAGPAAGGAQQHAAAAQLIQQPQQQQLQQLAAAGSGGGGPPPPAAAAGS
jgi:dual-specificity kinase